jgi:deoxyribonuclease-4
MRRLGVHTSIAGGLHLALQRAHDLGCTTLQIFSHNPRGWAVRAITKQEKTLFIDLRNKLDLTPVYVHASYLINIASPLRDLRYKSTAMLEEEMKRADIIGADYVVLHAGSAHDAKGAERAVEAIRRALGVKRFRSRLLIENTSGRRGDFTSSIPELSHMIKGTNGLISGICIDSCHAFAAGYDIRNKSGLQKLSIEIEEHIGKGNIKLIHLNDSKGVMGNGTDRHEHIGMGNIGTTALGRFLSHTLFEDVTVILETPRKNASDDIDNISRVKNLLSS